MRGRDLLALYHNGRRVPSLTVLERGVREPPQELASSWPETAPYYVVVITPAEQAPPDGWTYGGAFDSKEELVAFVREAVLRMDCEFPEYRIQYGCSPGLRAACSRARELGLVEVSGFDLRVSIDANRGARPS